MYGCDRSRCSAVVVVVQLGQFKDALADLLSWLTETEATLAAAKAKPIGSDVKTIMVDIEKTEVSNGIVVLDC